MILRKAFGKPTRILSRLGRDKSGVALIEFAVVAPVFLTAGLFGFEIANLSIAKMKVSQIALSVADNASRLGQTDNGAVVPTITEADVDSVFRGAEIEGRSIDLLENGRVILSSLEYDPITDRQFIHWRRCSGDMDIESAYGTGTEKTGLTGDELEGMGSGAKITAPNGTAVMFVEIAYDHSPVFSDAFMGSTRFREEAAFIIRDDRNLQETDERGLVGDVKNLCD